MNDARKNVPSDFGPDSPLATARAGALLDVALETYWSAALAGDPSPTATLRTAVPAAASSGVPEPRMVAAEGPEGAPCEYEVIRRIGEGGMGVVFEARQGTLGRVVALKMMRPTLQDDPAARALFFAEASAMGRLEHPGIVTIFDAGVTDRGRPFYAMRLVKGEAWRKTIAARSLEDNLAIWRRTAEAVAFAHEQGIAHNDLKPDNIFVDAAGAAWVGDWGLATRLDAAGRPLSSASGTAGGTPAYMAPEVARGDGSAGMRTDIYLLGAMLFELLTGVPPHMATGARGALTSAADNHFAPAPTPSPTSASPDEKAWRANLAKLAEKMTAAADRPASVKSALDRLEKINAYRDAAQHYARGKALLTRAKAEGDYDLFQQATRALEEAVARVPGQEKVAAQLKETRLAHARAALGRKDFDLARSLAKALGDDPDAARLTVEVAAARRQQEARKNRLRAVAVLGGLAVLAGSWLAWRGLTTDSAARTAVSQLANVVDDGEAAKEIDMRFMFIDQTTSELIQNPLIPFSHFAIIRPDGRTIGDLYLETVRTFQENAPVEYKKKRAAEREVLAAQLEADPKKDQWARQNQLSTFDSETNKGQMNYTMLNPITGPLFEAFKADHPDWIQTVADAIGRWKAEWEKDPDYHAAPFTIRKANFRKRQAAIIAKDADNLATLSDEIERRLPDDPIAKAYAQRLRAFVQYYRRTED